MPGDLESRGFRKIDGIEGDLYLVLGSQFKYIQIGKLSILRVSIWKPCWQLIF